MNPPLLGSTGTLPPVLLQEKPSASWPHGSGPSPAKGGKMVGTATYTGAFGRVPPAALFPA